jgi:hypothetical protein
MGDRVRRIRVEISRLRHGRPPTAVRYPNAIRLTINIRGESYQLREKLKAGLLKPKLGADRGSDADASTDKP